MIDYKLIAERAAVASFLNCCLRETHMGEWLTSHPLGSGSAVLRLRLLSLRITLYAVAEYQSPTGRHLFALPLYSGSDNSAPAPIGVAAFVSLVIQELSSLYSGAYPTELLGSVLQSLHHTESFLRARRDEAESLCRADLHFLRAEQSLLFGHAFHPTPKSRQGFPEWRSFRYSPEMKGSFRLHYFAAHRSIVHERSEWRRRASDIVRDELLRDAFGGHMESSLAGKYMNDGAYRLIPVHPIQAAWLLEEPHTRRWLLEGSLVDLGPLGKAYSPTSSVRTVYRPDSYYMYKFSLKVKITNSMRLNKRTELDCALEASRLIERIAPPLRERYPHFRIIRDAAYMTLADSRDETTGFEMLIRHNPFIGEEGERAIVTAALTQEAVAPNAGGLLAHLAEKVRETEGGTTAAAGLSWFRQYLNVSLRPMLWLYAEYGIALEAHLQNCVVSLDRCGYPQRLYYRDSQGYSYARSALERLEELAPGIRKSANVCDDAIVEERFGYYLIVNHMFGLIQAFGYAGLLDERVLLMELRAVLEAELPAQRDNGRMVRGWLENKTFRCKANLLTRLMDIDEPEQAVYAAMPNPLHRLLPSHEAFRKAGLATASRGSGMAT